MWRRVWLDMRLIVRWLAAGLVTVTAFAGVTWLCGALVLANAIDDSAARWSVAGGLGVAVAALAALWGHSFAEGGKHSEGLSGSDAPGAGRQMDSGSGNTRNKISGGTFYGPVIQGRDHAGFGDVTGQTFGPSPQPPAQPSKESGTP